MQNLSFELIRNASKQLRTCTDQNMKNQVLVTLKQLLSQNTDQIIIENKKDLKNLDPKATKAFHDRLLLDATRITSMCKSLDEIILLKDPVGEIIENRVLSNQLNLKRTRSPIGVIFLIYESRPNVAIESFSLAFKSGNTVILRGGKESLHTVTFLYSLIHEALVKNGFLKECCTGVTNSDRQYLKELLLEKSHIDLVIPRGSEQLINFVQSNTQIPIIKNDRGMCHLYVHEDADLNMAIQIIENAKTQRPGVCNSIETIIVHARVAEKFLPLCFEQLSKFQVEWFVDEESFAILKDRPLLQLANAGSYDTEYLDLKINCKIVESLDAAIEFIQKHSSKHSESIITSSEVAARKFQSDLDSAVVYWNASTRFTDGFAFGLGGEIGISTQKLHVRGPVGLNELTTLRWIIDGKGQIRI